MVLIGIGRYRSWKRLNGVNNDLRRFANYVKNFGDVKVHSEGRQRLTAEDLRKGIPKWVKRAGPDDDLVLVWSGHGVTANSRHFLVTDETPTERGDISSENAIPTVDMGDWLLACRARRIVVILDTCWSGVGAAELADTIATAVRAANPAAEATRSCEIIAAARNEPAEDSAFMTAALKVVEADQANPLWPAGTNRISPAQLLEAVNPPLVDSDQQAESKPAYGNLAAFFPLAYGRDDHAQALPPSAVVELSRQFDEELAENPITIWTVDGLREAATIQQEAKAQALADRLESAALALEAKIFFERKYGPSGLMGRYEVALRQLFPARTPPAELYDFFEQVARQRPSTETEKDRDDTDLLRYVAALARQLDPDRWTQVTHEWGKAAGFGVVEIDQAVTYVKDLKPIVHLEIDLGFECGPGRRPEEPAARALGRLFDGGEPIGDPLEDNLGDGLEPGAPEYPARLIASVFEQAKVKADIDRVDVILLGAELPRVDAPHVRFMDEPDLDLEDQLGRVVPTVTRSGDRRYRSSAGSPKAAQPSAPEWFDPPTDCKVLTDDIRRAGTSIALRRQPAEPRDWAVLALYSLYLGWHQSGEINDHDMKRVELAWRRLPENLMPSSYDHEQACGLVAVWNDPSWVSQFEDLRAHRASFS